MFKLRLKEHCSCQEVEEENIRYLSWAKWEISLPSPPLKESFSRAGNNLRKMFSLIFSLQFPHQYIEATVAAVGFWAEAGVELVQSLAWGTRADTGASLRLPRQHFSSELRVGLPKHRTVQCVALGKGRWVVLSWIAPLFVLGWAEGRLEGRAPSLPGTWEPSWMETADYFLFLN